MKVSMMDDVDYTFEDSILYSGDMQKIIMCSKVVNGVVRIPDRVKYISDFAFYWCRNIEEIILPDTIEYIGRYAFKISIYNHRTTKTNQKYPSVNL